MTKRAVRVVLAVFAVALAGCATNFYGDAKFPGGEAGCSAKCAEKGMTMGAFVYMGDYSTGCVCQPKASAAPPPPPAPIAPTPTPIPSAAPPLPAKPPVPATSTSSAASLLPTGAVVAVVTRMRQMREQQQQMAQAHH